MKLKSLLYSLIAAVAMLTLATVAFAQDSLIVVTPSTLPPWLTPDLLKILIGVMTPIIVKIVDVIPWAKIPVWSYPIMAGVIGLGLSLLGNVTLGANVPWYWGVGLGFAGIGLRELLNQLKKRITGVDTKAVSA